LIQEFSFPNADLGGMQT